MSMISHVYIKDGKLLDYCDNSWHFQDTNTNETTGVSDPTGGSGAIHVAPYHFPICSKLNNKKDSKFLSLDFYYKLEALNQVSGSAVFYSIGPEGSGYGECLTARNNALLVDDGVSSKTLVSNMKELLELNKWNHIKITWDKANGYCKAEINGTKYINKNASYYISNNYFSTNVNYIGTWTYAPRYGINTATADYYDFKLYDSDIIGWDYKTIGNIQSYY